MHRRLLATVATVAAIAVAVGGCGDGSGANGSSGPTGPPTASAATTASPRAVDNTNQVCADAKDLRAEYKEKAADILTRAVTAGTTDPLQFDRIIGEMVPLAKDYKARFEALATTATAQRVRTALTTMAAKLDGVTAENASDAVAVTEGVLTRDCGWG
ncbi:hypothetical protein [Virgisporangium ochraceum]|uniref:Lipoprotein n=1 Tax=Virgisporangium ochraceum TaxID=65505 RepID=A0A8J4ECS1_9ACTN|nr:hypothetical protein [Virgisporangium ochraceum]GIJ70780.1 hypothetical protein Voc01_056970 [Virgisporangium ochraceum]